MRTFLKGAVIVATLALAACATTPLPGGGAGTTGVSTTEANSVDAGARLYVIAGSAYTAFCFDSSKPVPHPPSGKCSADVIATAAKYSAKVRHYLDEWITANQNGDSGAVKVAMDAFNAALPEFTGYLAQHGVGVH
jgi:hypothetical protein